MICRSNETCQQGDPVLVSTTCELSTTLMVEPERLTLSQELVACQTAAAPVSIILDHTTPGWFHRSVQWARQARSKPR